MANYLLDIVILLTAALVAVPLFRAAGFGAELGVILLLFVIGIELRPARLWRMRRMVFGLGTLQVLITGAFLTIGAHVPLLAAQEFAIGADIAFALLETAAILLLVALIVVKFAVLWPLARSFGLRSASGAAVGLLLSQSGEFSLILFAYTHQVNLTDSALFQQLFLVVVLSMLVAPFL
jgi:Kef-type K+ transport system membrane component KefB